MSTDNHKELRHVGLIMDGNRRWARSKGLPAIEGHRQGYKNLKRILYQLKNENIEFISVYAFSTENWDRSKDEVNGLMKLLAWVIKNELKEFMRQERKVVFIGSDENVPKDVLQLMRKTEKETGHFTEATLAICFNYGGQQEIVDAVQNVVATGEDITVDTISKHLYKPEVPPLDLIIRTSGEQRISNYMLWRAAYAELAFTKTLWPDFSPEELSTILKNYRIRQRRFGK